LGSLRVLQSLRERRRRLRSAGMSAKVTGLLSIPVMGVASSHRISRRRYPAAACSEFSDRQPAGNHRGTSAQVSLDDPRCHRHPAGMPKNDRLPKRPLSGRRSQRIFTLCGGISHGLGKSDELPGPQLHGSGQLGIIHRRPKNSREPLGGAKQIDVLPDEAGIDRCV